jgi:predicted transcriptional regulator
MSDQFLTILRCLRKNKDGSAPVEDIFTSSNLNEVDFVSAKEAAISKGYISEVDNFFILTESGKSSIENLDKAKLEFVEAFKRYKKGLG